MTEQERQRRKKVAASLVANNMDDDEKARRKKVADDLIRANSESPGVKSSGSGDIYEGGAQRRRTNVDSRSAEAQRLKADQTARNFVNANRGKETAYYGTGVNGSKVKTDYVVTTVGGEQKAAPPRNEMTIDPAELKNIRENARKQNALDKIAPLDERGKDYIPQETAHVATDKTKSKPAQVAQLTKSVANEEFTKREIDRKEAIDNSRERVSAEYTQTYEVMSPDAKALLSFINREEEEQTNINWMAIAAGLSGQSGSNAAAAGQYAATLTTSDEARRMLKDLYGMSDDEIDAAVILHKRARNEEIAIRQEEETKKMAQEHPILSSALAVPTAVSGSVMPIFEAVDTFEDKQRAKALGMGDIGYEPNSIYSAHGRMSDTMMNTVAQDIEKKHGKMASETYLGAMSGVINFAQYAAFGKATEGILTVSAGVGAYKNGKARGLSDEESLKTAAIAMAAEFIGEHIGGVAARGGKKLIGKTLSEVLEKGFTTKTLKGLLATTAKTVGANAFEEGLTSAINLTYDYVANGDLSEYQTIVDNSIKNGKTPEEAQKEAAKEIAMSIVSDMYSGGVAGLLFNTSNIASFGMNQLNTAATGRSIKNMDAASAVIAEGQAAPADSDSKKRADKLAKKQTDGGKVSDYKLGQLAEANNAVREAEGEGSEITAKMDEAFKKKLGRELAEIDRAEVTNPTAVIDGEEVTIDGGNFDAKTKSFGEFKGIFKDKDGDNAVKTTDGREIKVSELKDSIKDKTVARLYENTKELSSNAANLFIENYDGESIGEYRRAFDYYYKMGRTGMSLENIRKNDDLFGNYLTAPAQAKIAAAGLKDREFRKGFTDLSVTRKTERYRFESRVLQYIGEKRNLEIFVIDEDSNINGTYLTGTNRIVIRRNAEGKLLLRTASHESFHFIKNQIKDEAGKAELAALENTVLDALKSNGMDIEAEIERLGAITDDEGNLVYETREDCVEEIVANSMFDAFMNEKFVKKMMNENTSLFGRIANKVKEVLADIRKAVATLGSRDAAIKALKDDVESLEKIDTMFDSLLEKAGESYKAEHGAGQKNNADDGVKYSINNRFYTQLDNWDGKTEGFSFVLGNTSEALLSAGIPKKQIKLDASKLKKTIEKHSGMTIEVFKQLPQLLENPIVVIDSKQDSNSKIIMGDLYDTNGKVVTAVLKLNPSSRKGNILDIIKVSSAEGRSHIKSLFQYDDGTTVPIRYKDEKRIHNWLNVNRLQSPLRSTNTDSTYIISNDSETVKQKLSVKASVETLSELKEKREGLVAEYRELRTQIDAIKESDEYKAFDNEVRTVRKNGSKFGGFAAVKEIRNRQKQWAEAAGLSALEERYDDISGQIHDYDLEIYKADKELKAKATAQLTEKVSKFSRDEIMDYAKKAAAKFGITKKFDNAGYMLPDGGLLDFSDGQGYRVLDHREIRDVLDFLPEDGNRSDGLIQFMNMGNIRMQIGGIDISRAPTKEQIAELRRFFDKNNGEITVDFSKDNGDNAGTLEYPEGTSSIRILNDIKKYFESGELPQISATAAFHSMYSQRQQSGIEAYWAETVRENHSFRNIISLLGEMQIAGGKVQLDGRDIDRIVRDTLKNTSSSYDKTQLTDELTVLYDYLANSGGNADTEEIYTSLLNITNGILEQSEMKDSELFDQYKNVRDYLRTQPIYITPAVKKEIESQFGDYKSFRNMLMGKAMRLSTVNEKAATLDEVWQELSELAPEYFPKDMNELDMPMQLTAFFEAVAPKVVNPYEHFEENIEDAAAELATDIFQKYFEIGRLKTPQEKYRNLVFENMKKLEQSKKEMRSEFKKKAAQDAEGYRTRIAEYKLQREQGDRRRRLRNEIDRNYNYLNRRIVKETDSDHVPEKLKSAVSAFRYIVPDSNGHFSRARFTEFENEYRKLEDSTTFFDEGMAQRIAALGERLTQGVGAPRMRELDNYELEELRNITEHIKYVVQNENRLFSESNKGRVEDYAKAIHSELEGKKESRMQGVPDAKYKGRYKDVAYNGIDALIKGFTKPEYLFGSIGSPTVKRLFDALRKGENTEARIIFDAKKAETEIKKKYGYDPRWNTEKMTVNFRGGKLTMTVEQAMALYATSKRKQGLEHMLGGGVLLYTSSEIQKKNGKTKEVTKRDRHIFHEADIPVLQNSLTAEQKKYVNAMVDYITKEIGAKRNEVSMKLIGVERYKESYYFPIKVDRHFVDTSVGRQEVVSTIRNQSSAKRTVDHAQNPIEIIGFTDTVNNHIYDSALYCAYVLPINDFKRVYNYRDKELTGDGLESMMPKDVSIKEDIRRTNGVNAIKQIEDFMIALDSGSRYENLIPISAKMVSMAKKGTVMANLSIVVQQPTAVFRAMLYVNPKYFATWANKADIEEMKKYNGCALKKEIGYFDVNMGRTATDYMNEYTPGKEVKKDYSITDRIRNGNIMLKADQLAGWGASKADEQTWGAIWKACKKQTKAENSSLSGDALNEAAAELFQTVISKTQVYDSVFTKPDYMRRKEGLAMMTTAFMSEPLTSLNMLAEAVVNAWNARGSTEAKEAAKFCARAFGCYTVSLVVNNAVKSLIYTMRDDEEDESILEQYVANVLDGMMGDVIGMLPYIKDIFSIVKGYDLSRMDAAAFTTVIDAVKALFNENKSIEDKIMLMLKAVGQASGVPLYNVTRDAKAIIGFGNKIADGIKNGFEPTTGRGMLNEIKETFEWVPFVEADSKYEQLYKAVTEGDGRHYQRVYDNLIAGGKDEGTINGGIATELEKHDLRIADAYYATASGETVKASGIISELEGEGFSKDVINRALKKYEDNLKKKLDDDERVIKAAEARYNMDYDEYERIVDELVAEGHSEKIVKDKINSEKIELETKEDDFEVNEKPMYAASYDLKNAVMNGDASDVRTVYRKLLSETDGESANAEVRKYAAQAYKNGDISESQLMSYYTSYKSEGDDEDDIFWKVEDVKGGDGYRKYGKLYDAIEDGRNVSGTIDYYTSHGVKLEKVKSNITSEYKPKLTSLTPGTAEYNEMYDNVIDAFVAAGDTEAEAIKKVKKW